MKSTLCVGDSLFFYLLQECRVKGIEKKLTMALFAKLIEYKVGLYFKLQLWYICISYFLFLFLNMTNKITFLILIC